MADTDLPMAFKLSSSLVEQLDKALLELGARKDAAFDMVSFTDISNHFRDLEEKVTKKYAELEAKQKAFKQEQSDSYKSLAEREAAVAAKEQDMFNRIQVLKDAAVAALADSLPIDVPPPSVDTDDVIDATEKKVTSSLGETKVGPKEVTFHQELTRFCEQMDSHGLLSFVMKNQKDITVLCDELSDALKTSSHPGRLILDSLEGFYSYPPDANNDKKDTAALQGMRQSCINLLEAMNAMLAKADMGLDHLLTSEIKQQAKSIADEWYPKLARDGIIDAANGKSLEAEAFLQLLATFRIVSEFEEDQLCKLVLAVGEQRQAPELCRSLGLTHKMPGVINELISKGKLMSAVHFIHGFELVDKFPTVPLLMTFLKDLRRNSQAKRIKAPNSESVQYELNSKELAAVRDVIYCVEKYNLKADYPLDPLQRRVGQLERAQPDRKRSRESTNKPPHNRKRPHESTSKPPHNRKKRSNEDGVYRHRSRQAAAPVYMDRRPYAAPPQERYPQVNSYNYHTAPPPLPSQTTYSQQLVYEQNAFYYPPDVRVPAAAPPPAYSGYTSSSVPSSYQPYM